MHAIEGEGGYKQCGCLANFNNSSTEEGIANEFEDFLEISKSPAGLVIAVS